MDVKWICTYCGARMRRSATLGRPNPGVCPRKKNKGPHSWVKDK